MRKLLPVLLIALSACSGSTVVTPHPDGGAGDASLPDSGGPESGGGDAAASDGGGPPGDCVHGGITFQLLAGDAGAMCLGAPNSCVVTWLGIRPVGGSPLEIDALCPTDCNGCNPVACPALCQMPMPLSDAGVSRVWDGQYLAPGTCGSGTSCVSHVCAPAGQYIASMCAYSNTGSSGGPASVCSSGSVPTCVDVPFSWPPASPLETLTGVLGAPPALGCCPTASQLYACTYPDGGSGEACHNPALGCASSTTCGVGCDPVVTGRCDGG